MNKLGLYVQFRDAHMKDRTLYQAFEEIIVPQLKGEDYQMMKEDAIAVHARALKKELERDGQTGVGDKRIEMLDELISIYQSKPENRIESLEKRMDLLEKIFREHCEIAHKL